MTLPWIFIHRTEKVDGGSIVRRYFSVFFRYFSFFFSVAPLPLKNFLLTRLYSVSKAALILPFPLKSSPVHDYGKLTNNCLSFVADLRNAIHGFH